MSYTQNRKYPFVRLTIVLILGILAFPNQFAWWSQGIYFSGLFLICLMLLGSSNVSINGIAVMGIIFCLGLFRMGLHHEIIQKQVPPSGELSIIGQIKSIENNRLLLRTNFIDSQYCQKNLLVQVDTVPIQLDIGDLVHFVSWWQRIPPNRNPFSFNAHKYYAARKTYWQCFVSHDEILKLSSPSKSLFDQFGKKMVITIEQTFSPTSSLLVKALLAGKKLPNDTPVKQLFQSTGHMHLLAISGLHIGLLFLMLQKLFTPFRRFFFGKWIAFFLTIIILWSFVLFSGAKPSAVRAAFMFSIFAVAHLSLRENEPLNILALVAFVLLLGNPYLLWDIGFQLSFFAMTGILLLFQPILDIFQPRHIVFKSIYQIIVLSLCAVLFTAPVVIYYFGFVSISSILYSPLTITITGLLLPVIFAWLILHPVGILSGVLVAIIENLCDALLTILTFFEDRFNLLVDGVSLSPLTLIMTYLGILLLSIFVMRRTRDSLQFFVVFCLSMLLVVKVDDIYQANRVEVIIYDDKQNLIVDICHHDSCLVITQDTSAMWAANAYRTRKDIKSIQIIPNQYQNEFLFRDGNYFQVKETRFAVSALRDDRKIPEVNYLIFKGAKRPIEELTTEKINVIVHRDNIYTARKGNHIHNMWQDYYWRKKL